LSNLIMQLLAKKPEERPESAQAVADLLEQFAADRSVSRAACSISPVRSSLPKLKLTSKSGKKWPIMVTLAACLLLGLVAMWAVGVIKLKTRDGTIVLENVPADAEVLVDGVKVAIKLSGDGKLIEIQVAPGKRTLEIKTDGFKMETQEVTITSGERKPIGIRLEALARDSVGNDPDRRAAEYVLSIGGTVRVNDKDRDFNAAADLPHEPFRLTAVNLEGNNQVSDAGLAHLKSLTSLRMLNLGVVGLSNTGCAHLAGLSSLDSLSLWGNPAVTDDGLEHLKGLTKLTALDLNGTRLTNAGLEHISGLTSLRRLIIMNTQVTDAGLLRLRGLTNLDDLGLSGLKVSSDGLVHLKVFKKLASLGLDTTQVGDAGLAHLRECTNLTNLNLSATEVSDAGLAHLRNCRNLKRVLLPKTKVTAAGIEDLQIALPQCKIEKETTGVSLIPPVKAPATLFRWPADKLAAGKVLAPDFSSYPKLLDVDFANPESRFPNFGPGKSPRYEDGVYKHVLKGDGDFFATNAPRNYREFACELVGRFVGDQKWGWGLQNIRSVFKGSEPDSGDFFRVMLNEGVQVSATSGFGFRRQTDVAELFPVTPAPTAKPIEQWNRLLVIVKCDRLEVYINGTAIADPVQLRNIDLPWKLAMCSQTGVAEFKRFTVWDVRALPSLEERTRMLSAPRSIIEIK
jgi:hypothetical protein